MKRSDFVIKLTSVITFIALVIYIGYALYDRRVNPLVTAPAVEFTLTDGIVTKGYAVRSEEVLTDSENITVVVSEGEKVAKGQTVAVKYNGESALKRAEEIRLLKVELERHNRLLKKNDSTNSAKESVLSIAKAAASGDLSKIDALVLDVETYIVAAGEDLSLDELKTKIQNLEAEIAALEAVSQTDTRSITAKTPGTFSSFLDGFESVSPEDIEDLTPEAYEVLFSSAESVEEDAFGKTVYGTRWYYVTLMGKEDAAKLKEGKTAVLKFSKTYTAELKMTVESISEESGGKCVVVFSSGKYFHTVASVREMTAEVVFSTKTGIRVPKEAVRIDEDGQQYIYIVEGLQARRVDITIIARSGDYYMSEKRSGGLRAGYDIIVKANDLYDGKVVS